MSVDGRLFVDGRCPMDVKGDFFKRTESSMNNDGEGNKHAWPYAVLEGRTAKLFGIEILSHRLLGPVITWYFAQT